MRGTRSDGVPPGPRGSSSYDELTERLRLLRAWSGLSYREIHRRVVSSRRARGIAELPVQDTVHRCMQPGRTRLDVELVVDIATVLLGEDEAAAAEWRHAYQVIAGEATDAAMVTVLDTLPDDIAELTGRGPELAQLVDDEATATVTVIEGMAGVGKTKLAMYAAHRLLDQGRFADLQLVADLRGYDVERPPADPSAVLDGFLRRLGVPGCQLHGLDLERRTAKFREQIAGKAALVVLDNAMSEEQVLPLLPDSPTCRVIVTSRRRLEGLPGAHVTLREFCPSESMDLLRHQVGRDRVDADRAAAARIAELVGHLPLALALTASRIQARPDWSLSDHLERLVDRRTTLRLDDGVEVALATSYDGLTIAQQRLLRLLALHPGRDIDGYAVAALVDTDVETAGVLLAELRTANLLLRSADRFEFHDLVRVFATSLAYDDDPAGSRRAALTRLFDFYRYAAAQAMNRYAPQEKHRRPEVKDPGHVIPELPDKEAAVRWLSTERENLIAVAVHAAEREWPRHASQLSGILFRYFENTHDRDAETLHLHACRVAEGAELARSLTSLGSLYMRLGRHAEAADRHRASIELYHELGDRRNVACAMLNLGVVSARLGRYGNARDQFQLALDEARELGERGMEATAVGNLGVLCERMGRYAEAIECAEAALTLARASGARATEGSALNNLGLAYASTGRHIEAVDCHQQAVDVARDAGNRSSEGSSLNNLGAAYTALGRYTEARAHHDSALAVALETSNRELECEVLNDLGTLLAREGEYAAGVEHHQRALEAARELGDEYEQAQAEAGIAECRLALGDVDAARLGWKLALALHVELGTPEAGQLRARLRAIDTP